MATTSTSRKSWLAILLAIIAIGILSRTIHTGLPVFDKYLGDALYAAMVYTILRLIYMSASVAVPAMLMMTAIELFQLTMIPAHMLGSEHLMIRISARLIGTSFTFLDLLAYAIGIACLYLADSSATRVTLARE